MTQLSLTRTSDGTTSDVNSNLNNNWTELETVVNSNLDNANIAAGADIDVTKLANGSDQQVLTTVGTTPTWAAPGAVSGTVPAGAVFPYAGSAAPTGYLLCDGTAVSRSTYADLFTAIGTTFGAGDGSTTFNVPNLKGKVPVGINSAETEFDTRGETGGAKTHTLTTAQLAGHSHDQGSIAAANESTHTHGAGSYQAEFDFDSRSVYTSGGSVVAVSDIDNQTGAAAGTDHQLIDVINGTSGSGSAHTHTISGTTGSAGGGTSHNILQPYIALHYVVKT